MSCDIRAPPHSWAASNRYPWSEKERLALTVAHLARRTTIGTCSAVQVFPALPALVPGMAKPMDAGSACVGLVSPGAGGRSRGLVASRASASLGRFELMQVVGENAACADSSASSMSHDHLHIFGGPSFSRPSRPGSGDDQTYRRRVGVFRFGFPRCWRRARGQWAPRASAGFGPLRRGACGLRKRDLRYI